MSFSTTTRVSDHYSLADLLNADCLDSAYHPEVLELLRRYYPDPDLEDEIDADLSLSDPEYVIKTCENLSYDDAVCVVNYFHVHLPGDEVAEELAAIINGDVVEGLHDTGTRSFVVSFVGRVTIQADSENDAVTKLSGLDLFTREAQDHGAEFVAVDQVTEDN